MPAFSKFAPSGYVSPAEDDLSVFGLGSPTTWSPPPLSNNRSGPAGYDFGPSRAPQATPVNRNSRRTNLAAPFYHTGSAPSFNQNRVSEDRRTHSHISISSDNPSPTELELTNLREENDKLKVECGNLRGQITGLWYVPSLLHYINFIYRITRNSHSELLGSVDESVKSMREDVKQMFDRIMTHIAGPVNGSSGPVDTRASRIPLDPQEEDFLHLSWWRQGPWLAIKTGAAEKDLHIESPIISLFMEDEHGRPISPGVKKLLRNDLFFYWNGMYDAGEIPTIHTETSLARKEEFRKRFEAKFPWLRLCEGQWKVDQCWINYFASWKRPRTSKTPEKSKSGAVDEPTQPQTGAPTAEETRDPSATSKRRFEDPKNEEPSKRHKGKGVDLMEPTKFHHGPRRPLPKKKQSVKMAKVSLSILYSLHMY